MPLDKFAMEIMPTIGITNYEQYKEICENFGVQHSSGSQMFVMWF